MPTQNQDTVHWVLPRFTFIQVYIRPYQAEKDSKLICVACRYPLASCIKAASGQPSTHVTSPYCPGLGMRVILSLYSICVRCLLDGMLRQALRLHFEGLIEVSNSLFQGTALIKASHENPN